MLSDLRALRGRARRSFRAKAGPREQFPSYSDPLGLAAIQSDLVGLSSKPRPLATTSKRAGDGHPPPTLSLQNVKEPASPVAPGCAKNNSHAAVERAQTALRPFSKCQRPGLISAWPNGLGANQCCSSEPMSRANGQCHGEIVIPAIGHGAGLRTFIVFHCLTTAVGPPEPGGLAL